MERLTANGPVTLTATVDVQKRCPVKDEVDFGSVTVEFADTADVPELHDLARYLKSYVGVPLSHENFVLQVLHDLGASHVTSKWTTAGLSVVCEVSR